MGFNDICMVDLSKFRMWKMLLSIFCCKFFFNLVNCYPVNEFIMIIREDVIEYVL